MKLVHGVGFNDADYKVNPLINNRRVCCKAYQTWRGMLQRAYSTVWHKRYPTYIGVTVCDEWHRFSNFKKWYDINHVDGWQLDKDIITNSKMYSPSSCIFVPGWLNKFIIDSGAIRGDMPIGVSLHKRGMAFQSNCKNPISGKKEYLGWFSSPVDAHRAWIDRKTELAYLLKDYMDAIDCRIYLRVVEIIFNAK